MGCRILAGKIYVRDLSVADQPFYHIGNAQISLAIAEETQELPDYTSVAGGVACSVRDISGVEITMTLYDFLSDNLALAVFGEATDDAADNVVAEAVMAFAGGALNPLAHIPTVGTVDVKVGLTTYVEDEDYTVVPGGFVVIEGSDLATAIAAGTGTPKHLAVTVDYDYAAEETVEALVTSGKTFEIRIDGRNRADGAKGEVWNFHKVQFGPVAGLNIITREFGQYELKATVIADTSKPEGESQYFTIQKVA